MWNVKALGESFSSPHSADLIDTLWNVKINDRIQYVPALCDLIDTLWNVKSLKATLPTYSALRFNRYIVECKERRPFRHHFRRRDLIDTLWNVKLVIVKRGLEHLRDLIDTLWNVKPALQNVYQDTEHMI